MSPTFVFITLLWSLWSCGRAQQIQQVTPPVEHGEGPHWDCGQNKLYFVDIMGQAVLRYDPVNADVKTLHFDGPVSPVIPVLGTLDQLVVGVGRDLLLVSVDWGAPGTEPNVTQDIALLATVDEDKPENRFNDGKADKNGRLWIGTMGPEPIVGQVVPQQGSLFRFTPEPDSVRGSEHLEVETFVTDIDVSNGIVWNDIYTKMYYIDSLTFRVDVFDYDLDNGTISNRRSLKDFNGSEEKCIPDGMTGDSDGNLWVACFAGSKVLKINSTNGEILQKVSIPASLVTSVVFGDKNLDTLYVTTSRVGLSDEAIEKQPASGSVFAVKGLGVAGMRPGSRKAVIRK